MKIVKVLLLKSALFSSLYVSSAMAQETVNSPAAPISIEKDLDQDQAEKISVSDLNLKFDAVLRVWALFPLKPSAIEHHLQFKLPQTDFVIKASPSENLLGYVKIVAGPKRDTDTDQMELILESAYIEFAKIFGTTMKTRYGLIPHQWLQNQSTLINLDYATSTSKNFSNRYGYNESYDQGVSIQDDKDAFGWSFTFVNGEGEKSDEQGSGKESRVFARWSPLENYRSDEKNFFVAVGATYGSYENVSPESAKRRYQALVYLDQDVSWGAQAELFWGEDSVDAIQGSGIADDVDLLDQGGLLAKSFGYSARVYYSWRDAQKSYRKYQVFVRHDYLDPMTTVEDRGLQAQLLGFSYFPYRNLQMSLSLGQVEYEANHSTAVNDAQEINFATTFSF